MVVPCSHDARHDRRSQRHEDCESRCLCDEQYKCQKQAQGKSVSPDEAGVAGFCVHAGHLSMHINVPSSARALADELGDRHDDDEEVQRERENEQPGCGCASLYEEAEQT